MSPPFDPRSLRIKARTTPDPDSPKEVSPPEPAAAAGGGSEPSVEMISGLAKLREVITERLTQHTALMSGTVEPTETLFPTEMQKQIDSSDLHQILELLSKGLSSTLGEDLLKLKEGKSLYLKRGRDKIKVIDESSGNPVIVEKTLPRSIQFFSEKGELKVAIETKNKLSEKDEKGILRKIKAPREGASKKVKSSWIIGKEGYKQEASIMISAESQAGKTYQASFDSLDDFEKERIFKISKQELQDEMDIPKAIGDQALLMTRGPYMHTGKYGKTIELRAPLFPFDMFDLVKEKKLYTSLNPVDGLREKIALEIIRGIKLMHDNGFVHSDIKLENILLDEKFRPVITDFGNSCKETDRKAIQGTEYYLAPESILAINKADSRDYTGKRINLTSSSGLYPWKLVVDQHFLDASSTELANKYVCRSKANDCWALGLVLLQLYSNDNITAQPSETCLLNKVLSTDGPFTDDLNTDDIIREIIKPLLNPDPETRMTCAKAYETLQALLHEKKLTPFFQVESDLPTKAAPRQECGVDYEAGAGAAAEPTHPGDRRRIR